MERPLRIARRRIDLPIGRIAEVDAAARRRESPHGRRRGRPACPAYRRRARPHPSPRRPTSTPSRSRTPRAIAAAASRRHGAVLAQHVHRNAELGLLHRVRIGDDAAHEGVARSGNRGQALCDEASGARLGGGRSSGRGRGREARTLLHRAARPRRTRTDRAPRAARRQRVRPLLGPGLDEQVDVDLELAGADRDVDTVAVTACLVQRPRDGRLADAVEAKRVPAARARACEDALAPARSRALAAKAAAAPRAGRAGRRRRSAASGARIPGAVPARPMEIAPSGSVACLRTPCVKSAYGRRAARRYERETASISRSSSSSTTRRTPAARATSSTVRSSCVGPRPPETRQRSASSPFAQRSLEIGRIISDDRDARRVEAEASTAVRRETGRCGPAGRPGRARSRWRRSPPAGEERRSSLSRSWTSRSRD